MNMESQKGSNDQVDQDVPFSSMDKREPGPESQPSQSKPISLSLFQKLVTGSDTSQTKGSLLEPLLGREESDSQVAKSGRSTTSINQSNQIGIELQPTMTNQSMQNFNQNYQRMIEPETMQHANSNSDQREEEKKSDRFIDDNMSHNSYETHKSSAHSHLTQTGRTSIRGTSNAPRQQQHNIEVKLKKTWFDHTKIMLYHFVEPIILAAIMSISFQNPALSTFAYVFIVICGVLPFLLTREFTQIKLKWFFCCLICLIAIPFFILKLVMMVKYKKDPENYKDSTFMQLLGIYGAMPTPVIVIDLVIAVLSFTLIFIYNNHKSQATTRMNIYARQDFQTDIKLHHPYFGRQHKTIYVIFYILILADCLVMPAVPQLINITLLTAILLLINRIKNKPRGPLLVMARIMQVLIIVQLLSCFFVQLPSIMDDWQKSHLRILEIFGIFGVQDSKNLRIYARFHYILATFALILTEMYERATKIEKEQTERIQRLQNEGHFNFPITPSQVTIHGQPQPSPNNQMLILSQQSALQNSNSQVSGVPSSLQRQRNFKKNQTEKKSFLDLLWSFSLIIWICRGLAFVWVYCYHDWQSVILLIWILHSTLFKDTTKFKRANTFFYLPLFTIIFFWYYVTNMRGLVLWPTTPQDKAKLYNYGFYEMKILPLELGFMFLCLVSFIVLHKIIQPEQDAAQQKKFLDKLGNSNSSILYQFLFMFLLYVEYPLMLFLVLAGLNKMDVYHIAMLLFFVAYTLTPKILNNRSIILICYANIFILEKYIYSLVVKPGDWQSTNWIEILGLDTSYDPPDSQQYFRYSPRSYQWALVLLCFSLYRREEVLGTDDKDQFAKYTKQAQDQIKLRLPVFYKVFQVLSIFYSYTIVITAFILYLIIILVIPSSLFNAITQMLVLVLLCVYLSSGIKKLLTMWNLLIIYQAFVLVCLVVYQFLVAQPGWENSDISKFFKSLPDVWKMWLKWLGFIKYEPPLNLKLLPYVIFFSLAVILLQNFKEKDEREDKHIQAIDLDLDSSLLEKSQKQKAPKPKITIEKEMQSVFQYEIAVKSDSQVSHTEKEFVYNYGFMSGMTTNKVHIQHHLQKQDMMYKLSYVMYKVKVIWPVLDIIAAYFNLFMYAIILAFAIYYQIAIFWAICLTVFMVMIMMNSKAHYDFRRRSKQEFFEIVGAQSDSKRYTISQEGNLEQKRQKYITKYNIIEAKQRSKSKNRPLSLTVEQAMEMNNNERQRQDSQLSASKDSPSQGQRTVSGPLQMNASSKDIEFIDQSQKRLVITDQEVVNELKKFQSEVNRVSLKSRYGSWIIIWILVIVGLTSLYLTSFVHEYETIEKKSPFSFETQQELTFIFFWSGMYSDPAWESYSRSSYPFYIMLVLLVFERMSQNWIDTRYGCTEELMDIFEMIDQQDLALYQYIIKKRRYEQYRMNARSIRKTNMIGRSSRFSQRDDSEQRSNAEADRDYRDDQLSETGQIRKLPIIQEDADAEDEQLTQKLSSSQRASKTINGSKYTSSQSQRDKLIEVNNLSQSYKSQVSSVSSQADQFVHQMKFVDRQTYENERISTQHPHQTNNDLENERRQLLESMRECMTIKYKLKGYAFLKQLLENFCILLVWLSCIYKLNVLSLVLFVVLTLYTFVRTSTTLLIVRTSVVVILVLQYCLQVIDLSSYNNPKTFPPNLIGMGQYVYPNQEHFYYSIPLLFSFVTNKDPTTGLISGKINLEQFSFWGLDVSERKLNGMWIDFLMVIFVAVYLSLCNFWVLYKPIKIVLSEQIKQDLKKYSQIEQERTGQKLKNIYQTRKDLKLLLGQQKGINAWQEHIFTNFPLYLISFTLAISIFNNSILSFGYIIFVMILIFSNLKLRDKWANQDSFYIILKYILLPYLLFDILLTIIFQMPYVQFGNLKDWSNVIGLVKVWDYLPDSISFGENVDITVRLDSSLTILMLKGLVFFFITIQLQILESYSYKKYIEIKRDKELSQMRKVGSGITYRFNNFKSKQVLKGAKEKQKIEEMLVGVRRLLRIRQKLFEQPVSKQKTTTGGLSQSVDFSRTKRMSSYKKNNFLEPVFEANEHRGTYDEDNKTDIYEESLIISKEIREEKENIKKETEKRIKALNCCQKLYLWIRHNYVQDILFKQSDAHLDDIVSQTYHGRTSMRNAIEVGINTQTKNDFQAAKEEELQSILRQIETHKEQVNNLLIEQEEQLERDKTQIVEEHPDENQDLKLQNMIKNLDDDELEKLQRKEIVLRGVLLSGIYAPSTKPWEEVNLDDFLSWKVMVGRYLIALVKVLMSYSELFCYFWMIVATIIKAGWLYLVFPILIFGYCMLEEQRPGKIFWYFVIIYTQILLTLDFLLQLDLWSALVSDENKNKIDNFFEDNQLGIQKYQGHSFGAAFVFYCPGIFIIMFGLLHIQQESLAGMFNVPFEKYETFEQGLLRYRINVLAKTEEEKYKIKSSVFEVKIDRAEIYEYLDKKFNYYSDYDKYEKSEALGHPIRVKEDLRDGGSISEESRDIANESQDYINIQKENVYRFERNCLSENDARVIKVDKGWDIGGKLRRIFYDNSFFNRLFPLIRQQKPGFDLYVYVCTVQIIIVAYVFLLYSKMAGQDSDIAEQFAQNQYSQAMVVLLICTILIMVIDRILYSMHVSMSGFQETAKPIENNQQESKLKHSQSILQKNGEMQNFNQTEVNESIQLDGLYNRRNQHQDQSNKIDESTAHWLDQSQLDVIHDDDNDDSESPFKAYEESLIPQKTKKSFQRVVKFYWFWFVLISVHLYVFIKLPTTIRECKLNPQVNQKNGNIITYPDPQYHCNTFSSNPSIIIFYIICCIYFGIASYQMRIGLPEIRKGSFLVDSFNPVSSVIYRGYLAIPFIFELRSIIDWTFTTTALDVFQWIKLAQVQADMYVAKCVNKEYMARSLGTKIKLWEKVVVGFSLMIFILFLLVGPIILFSSLNPIAVVTGISGATLNVDISLSDSLSGTNQTLNLFRTNQATQIKNINQTMYDSLYFQTYAQTTAQFTTEQTFIVQFSETSDDAWIISAAKKNVLLDALQALNNGTLAPNYGIYYAVNYEFQRKKSAYGDVDGFSGGQITNQTQAERDLVQNLINQLTCTQSGLVSTLPAQLDILQKAGSLTTTDPMQTGSQAFTTDIALKFTCDPTSMDISDTYWSVIQNFQNFTDVAGNSTAEEEQQQVEIMTNQVFIGKGLGFFVFQQMSIPAFFSSYGTSLGVLYVSVVFVIATLFRSAFVPKTSDIFIIDPPFTEDILKICQSIHIYRVQQELAKEEELFMILIDIMRSPEMIKSICGSSLKKKLQ